MAGVGARVILTTGKEALKGRGVDSGLAKLPCCLGGRGKSFDDIAAGFRTFADGLEGRGLAGAGQSLQAVDAVGRVENFLDDPTLGVVQKGSCVGLFSRPLRSHHRLDGVPPLQNIADVGAFGGDGFGRGEAASGVVLHALDEAELSRLPAPIELRSDVPIRCLAHAATESVPENRPLVGDSLALEDAVAGERDGFFGEGLLLWLFVLLLGAVAGGGDDLLRLISEAGGHLLVRGKNLFRSERLLAVAGGVSRDLRGLRAAVAGLFQLLLDLPGAGAGGVKILLRVSFDLRCAASPGLDFVSKPAAAGKSAQTDRRRSHTAGSRRKRAPARHGSNRSPAP